MTLFDLEFLDQIKILRRRKEKSCLSMTISSTRVGSVKTADILGPKKPPLPVRQQQQLVQLKSDELTSLFRCSCLSWRRKVFDDMGC